MASRATTDTDDGVSGEFPRPDAAKAFQIYDDHISPKLAAISTLTGDCSDPWRDIKKTAHFPRSVMNFIITLENIEDEAKRDHHLLALTEGLRHRGLTVPDDLVSRADGSAGASVVPIGKRKPAPLATLGNDDAGDPPVPFQMGVPSDGTETDLADAGEDAGIDLGEADAALVEGVLAGELDDGFTETTEEELAQQEGRGEKPMYQRMKELTDGTATASGEDDELPQAAE